MNQKFDIMRRSINQTKEIIKTCNVYIQETERKLEKEEKHLSLMVDTIGKLEKNKTFDSCLSYLNTLQMQQWLQNDINSGIQNIDALQLELSLIRKKTER